MGYDLGGMGVYMLRAFSQDTIQKIQKDPKYNKGYDCIEKLTNLNYEVDTFSVLNESLSNVCQMDKTTVTTDRVPIF
jgi:hypothetical protein